ncbi:LacI family DNA-binding transcriptional regulator [Rhizobium sp. TRM96647]|uniref:LacI family DNA-binding transcriptional regulator n=1 Tax=unclassified Rhizobium TaxID=2613769 RepID=UPI0021E6F0B4|nr:MULTISPECIES: LacI family DNA-binding transcriptional regulator [unclassified Rhizobium]MCV3738835.1 LacI family DNA-binding transcriptional regulator [Rhizobium sp. TRM96647]MCV3760458.1 LacI family DNA-binding transcriptional regulator [Rhizobium sp. TRM96650]
MSETPEKRLRSRRLSSGGVRMVDVARRAGTSTQTVSRVLSRPELVADETRKLVEQAIRDLNYIPNSAARLLASSVSHIVAVIIPSLSATVYAQEVHHIVRVLEEHSFSVVIGHSDYSELREERLVQSFLERRPDGFILTGTQHTDLTRQLLRNSGVPVVETFDGDNAAMDTSIGFSNFEAGRRVAELFRSRGLTRIAYVGGRRNQDFRSNARFDGLRSRLNEEGLAPVARVELTLPMPAGDGVRGLDRVLAIDPLTQAIFFSADNLAISALLECNRRGIRVPEQLAICGFGNYDFADAVVPSLTTVSVPFEEIGVLAANAILARLDGTTKGPSRTIVPLQLLRRGSA